MWFYHKKVEVFISCKMYEKNYVNEVNLVNFIHMNMNAIKSKSIKNQMG